MDTNAILKDLKDKKYQPFYFLHGEEEYYIDVIVDYIQNHVLDDMQKSFDQTILYGKDVELINVVNAAKRYPMLGTHQVIIIKEAQSLKWKSEEEILAQYLENPTPTTILVLAYKHGKFDKRKKVFKSFQKNGVVFESEKIRDYKVTEWIQKWFSERNKSIEPQAAHLLSEYLGNNLSKVVNELEKLVLNVPANTAVNLQHIEHNIGISKDFNVFELQTALGTKNAYKAFQIVDYFAKNPKSSPFMLIIASLNNYFVKVLKYHYLPDKSPQAASKQLGVASFFVGDYEKASRLYPRRNCFDVIQIIAEYDLKSKGLGANATPHGELLKELIFKILNV